MESTDAGSMGMKKYIVKKSHWRIAETTFEALALVYLKPWVTMLEDRSESSSTKKNVTENTCWRRSYQLEPIRNRLSGAVTGFLICKPFFWKNSWIRFGSCTLEMKSAVSLATVPIFLNTGVKPRVQTM